MLPDQTEEAYRARIVAQARRDAEAAEVQRELAQREREETLWRTAEQIVAAEVAGLSGWRKDRRGAQYRFVTLRILVPDRGLGAPRRVRLRSYDGGDACFGPQGPIYPTEGKLVLFTQGGKLSDAAVIDWTSAARSTHPETLALLERSRGLKD